VINIESNLVGLVIGRQGENLRRIEQDSGARIQFITPADHPGPQRQCRISGNPRSRADAKREIFRTIEDNNVPRDANRGASNTRQAAKSPSLPALREGENAMQIMVPDRTVGLIIGRGGETIRDLQERSGCHINIVGVQKSINGLRPVNLIGTPEASQKAKDLIMEIVESDTRGPGAQNDAPPQNGGHNPRNDFQQNQNRDHGKINETIYVPSEAVGMIIGKGGETIKEMQSTTQCKINVTQASGADVEREIGLVGTAQAIEQAKRAIMDKVDMVVSFILYIYEELQTNNLQREKGNQRGGGGGRQNDNGDRYSQQQHGQQGSYGQQPYGQQQYAQAPAAAAPAADPNAAADPYAAYGGYANYMALWYQALQTAPKQDGQ
jgi:far upstream element-binding protein